VRGKLSHPWVYPEPPVREDGPETLIPVDVIRRKPHRPESSDRAGIASEHRTSRHSPGRAAEMLHRNRGGYERFERK
jgi:hypothetical protein